MLMNTKQVSVPKKLITSKNCIVIPAGNNHTFYNGKTFKAGDNLVFDLDACPKRGDLVAMFPMDRPPFVRECFIAPLEQAAREQWAMAVQGADKDALHFLDLGKFEKVGVFRGKVPKRKQKSQQ